MRLYHIESIMQLLVDYNTFINPYPYGPIANLFPMGGGRHVSPSYDVF